MPTTLFDRARAVFLKNNKFGLTRRIPRALFEVTGIRGGVRMRVEGARGRNFHVGVADLLPSLLETRANVLDALGELGQRRQHVVLRNLCR